MGGARRYDTYLFLSSHKDATGDRQIILGLEEIKKIEKRERSYLNIK
jgi:hypothetical protein